MIFYWMTERLHWENLVLTIIANNILNYFNKEIFYGKRTISVILKNVALVDKSIVEATLENFFALDLERKYRF